MVTMTREGRVKIYLLERKLMIVGISPNKLIFSKLFN